MGEPDYLNIEVDDDKPPSDYSYGERRAEEIQLLKQKYLDPNLVPKSKLANRYDVTLSQICQDFDRIIEYLDEYGEEKMEQRVKAFLDSLFDKIVEKRKFYKNEEGQKYPKDLDLDELHELYTFVRSHTRWMLRFERIETEPEEIEGDIDVSITKQVVGEDDGD